jgi:hypothetical protein
VFGRDLPPLPPVIFITKSLSETQNCFSEMNFSFRFAKQTKVHTEVIENVVWTPQYHILASLGKGLEPFVGRIMASRIPHFQKLINGLSLVLKSFNFLVNREGDSLPEPKSDNTTSDEKANKNISDSSNVNCHLSVLEMIACIVAVLVGARCGILAYDLWGNRIK